MDRRGILASLESPPCAELAALFVFAGLTAIGCNDRKTTPPAVVPVAHSMPSSRPTESRPATPGESRPPTLSPGEQQKVLGKWERKTSGKEETLELKADGTAEWLERRDDGSIGPGRRDAPASDLPVQGRQDVRAGARAGGWAVFTVFGVTDDEMEVEFVRRTLTYTRVK